MGAFDGIILGTGHNALVLQAYLSRCGLRILSVERNSVVGGGLATENDPVLPGFRHNTHSFFHRALTSMPWYRDLGLARHGAQYIEPELNVALILRDGRCLEWWTDPEKTVASVAEFSRRDAESLRRWVDEFRPIVERILVPEARSAPLSPDRRRELLSKSALGRTLLAVAELSPLEFVEHEFENDTVRAGLLFFNGLREIDLRLAGFGHSIPALLAAPGKAQMCVGGSAQLARALIRDIEEHGSEVRTNTKLKAILVRDGRAAGVELENGERVGTKGFVASGLNPQQTFLELLDADAVPRAVRESAKAFRYNLLAPLFALNLALREPPRYRAAESRPELNRAFMVILGLERFSQFHDIVAAHEKGELPPAVMWGACPTLFDPSQAPDGKHTAFMWEKVPYSASFDAEEHGRDLLNLWSSFAPNLADGAVLNQFCRTPQDTEAALPNMACGDLLVGSFDGGQVGYHRPFAGAGQYRTPLEALYLCGGSTHPGGNITGLCGYNAASVIAADLGLKVWWDPPNAEAALSSL